MALSGSYVFTCTILPVGKVVRVTTSQCTAAAIQSALSAETMIAAEAFALYVKSLGRMEAWTPRVQPQDSLYALLRCRGGGKGGFRKQLEKKGREFVRAKMKEKRNSAKTDTKKDKVEAVKRRDHLVKPAVLKAEATTTRALVKQGLAFVVQSCQKKNTAL